MTTRNDYKLRIGYAMKAGIVTVPALCRLIPIPEQLIRDLIVEIIEERTKDGNE